MAQQSDGPTDERTRTLLTQAVELSERDAPEYEFVIQETEEAEAPGLMGDLVHVDLGVERLGEVSRALTVEGELAEIAGEEDSLRRINVVGIDGPVRVYNAQFTLEAAKAGPLELSFSGGVRAFGLSREWTGVPGGTVSLDDDASDDIVPMPVLGGSLSVRLADGWRIRTRATGQPMDNGDTYLDWDAHSEWALTPKLDLIAGYQFLDAAVTGATTGARLHTEGMYAQLRWRF